jgi:hypothetical protein
LDPELEDVFHDAHDFISAEKVIKKSASKLASNTKVD